jgi:hypothetical protein
MAEQPADAPLSEDGQWWWDGADWQPVEAGPQASYDPGTTEADQLSDDGQWRWDGTQWQPAGDTGGPDSADPADPDAPVALPDDLREEMANFGEYYPEVLALANANDMEDWLINVVGISQEDVPTEDDELLA